MNPAVPPMALITPALTLVGVTFMFGAAHCGWLKMFVDVSSMRSVGACGATAQTEFLVQAEVPEIQAGPLDRAALRRAEAADRRRAVRGHVEPAGDGRIVEIRIAQLIGTKRDGAVWPCS